MRGMVGKGFDLTPEEEKALEQRIALEKAAEKKYGLKYRTDNQRQADQKRRKAFAGHKLIFPTTTDPVNEITHEMVFGSIRSQVLQKLMFVNFMMCEYRSPLHHELTKIRNECETRHARSAEETDGKELVYYLKPEHVMKLIGCSRRTAVEYVEVIKSFYTMPSFLGLELERMRLEKEGKSPYDIYSGPSELAEAYPAIEEGQDSDRSPPPLPTWYYRFVMDTSKLKKRKQQKEKAKAKNKGGKPPPYGCRVCATL
jgi:hypothetical protein